jgi:hypothetical protein
LQTEWHIRRRLEIQVLPELKFRSRRIALPSHRGLRIAIGIGFVVLGIFGFLPILGFWMIPVGLLILSQDFASVRRLRRKFQVWFARRFARKAVRPA